jgi:hypothetical protein
LQGPSEAVNMVSTRYQHLYWPKLRWLILRNYSLISPVDGASCQQV